jgi:uncharacterized membrane protein
MTVLIVLFGAWLVLRAAGMLGIATLAAWSSSCRFALAAMFVFTGVAHFAPRGKADMTRMVPRIFPHPVLVIFATGVLELLGAVGLAIPKFQCAAAYCLIVLLIAMFPANVKAAREGLTVMGKPATRLWLRVPMQLVFIGLLWWSSAR